MSFEARRQEYRTVPDHAGLAPSPPQVHLPAATPDWTVLIPFRNEALRIADTLRSIAAQDIPFELILVDNGSTDSSCDVVARSCARLGLRYVLVNEPRRGKVHALACGLARVRTRFVATVDADTIYPPNYLSSAGRLLQDPSCAAAQAYYVRPWWKPWRRSLAAAKLKGASLVLPHQCHNGGAGQVFRTNALIRSGGFDPRRWPLILEDHEIIHRVSKFGAVRCAFDFWCSPSRRERDRASRRWTFAERLAYHFTPAQRQERFFYDFLAPRLEARRSACTTHRLMDAEDGEVPGWAA